MLRTDPVGTELLAVTVQDTVRIVLSLPTLKLLLLIHINFVKYTLILPKNANFHKYIKT